VGGSSASFLRRKEFVRFTRRLILFLAAPVLTGALLYLPDPGLRQFRFSVQGVVIADRSGEPLYSVPPREGGYQQRLSWGQIPESVRETFLRLEDRRFYNHSGVDALAVARAVRVNFRQGRIVSGASTISMQLARLIHPHRGGFLGKAGEILRALYLEARLSKQQILTLYLNNLPCGYNTVGVGAAARTYFSLPLDKLSRPQILLLAVIPKAPSLYDPFGSSKSRAALERRALALASLVSVSEEEIGQAMRTFRRGAAEIHAPHFVRYLLETLAGLERRGLEIARIVTTLDAGLYRSLSDSIRDRLAGIGRSSAYKDISATGRIPLRNAAALVLDNRGGEVLAWVGSHDFFDRENGGQIDGVRLESSSGSTLKPFLYTVALEKGYTAATLLPDLELTFGAQEGYRPENFDRRSRGLVRLRTALASSLNVPAVYLLSQIGLKPFLSSCRDLGIDLPEDAAAQYGLGAAIGNADVTLLELTRAFSVFPNRGILRPTRMILEIQTTDDRRIQVGEPSEGKRVFREQTAWLVSNILADPAARATGFGTTSRFNTAFPAIFKSGTASEYTNLWCLGPAGVVVQVLEDLSRRGGEQRNVQSWGEPSGLARIRICTQTGYRASTSCPATREEYFLAGSMPEAVCPVHGQSKDMEELLLEVVLGESKQPRVLFPRNGTVFYRDRGAAAEVQTIPGWIASDPEDRIVVRLNGRILALDNPSRPLLPVRPGPYQLEVVGRFGGDAVSYIIR
jgi:penicillin-binding protein 1C